MSKRRVVYLFGAGATQAAVNIVDDTRRLLMGDITEQVFLKIHNKGANELAPLSNVILNEGADIEHIITLLDSSHNQSDRQMASSLRHFFREEIQDQLGELASHLSPNLYAVLFDLHNVDGFDEELAGVITINYDQVADMGFAEVHGGVNFVANVNSERANLHVDRSLPAFIKLHGSFNWRNQFPISLVEEDKIDEENFLWMPPGLNKSEEQYPFDLLWGNAHELLDCDVLRVVGCSLSSNDMHLISLLFRTQQLSGEDQGYSIELVNYPEPCASVASRFRYLNIIGIMDQSDFVSAIASELFPGTPSGDQITRTQRVEIMGHLEDGGVNIFDRWIRMKAEKLLIETGDVSTEKSILLSYIEGDGR